MKAKLLLAGLIVAVPALAQAPQAPGDAQVDALMAFARTYGVVRYFDPTDALGKVDWNRFLVRGAERMGSVADRDRSGAQLEALFAPVADGLKVVAAGSGTTSVEGEGPRIEWRHLGYGVEPTSRASPYVSWRTHHDPLHDGKVKGAYFQHQAMAEAPVEPEALLRVAVAPGLEALVPVSLPMSATKVGEAQDAKLKALAAELESVAVAGEDVTRAQAWADGIAAWNVARHFYPYWSVVKIDWEAELRKWLAAQPERQSRLRLRDQLRRLIAPLDDGHGRIVDPTDRSPKQLLPIAVRPLGSRWVVEASLVPQQVQPGDVIVTVDGKPAARYFGDLMAIESGSPQFVRWRAARDFSIGAQGAKVALTLDRGGRIVNATIAHNLGKTVVAPRPDAIAEIRPGIYYVDLSRFDEAAFQRSLDKLRGARGIVFDMRGYPSPDAVKIVPYWLTGDASAQWMIVPRFDKPFAQSTTGWSTGWNIDRNADLEKVAKVLLTDGRALSYAESLIGYFAGQKAGRIVGEASGGANGDVAAATLPSGMAYLFTGMRVTRHDGTLLHGEGFKPDVPVEPTVQGLRAGRDEALERATQLVSADSKA